MQTFRYSIWRPEHNDIHLKIRDKEGQFTIFDQRDFKIFEFESENLEFEMNFEEDGDSRKCHCGSETILESGRRPNFCGDCHCEIKC